MRFTSIQKQLVWIGLLLTLLSFCVAVYLYPGGSLVDINAPGYSLSQNYISHLLGDSALNGKPNVAKPWGILAAILMGITTGVAFTRLAQKANAKHFSTVIKASGYALIIINALVTVPQLHNSMITVGSFVALLAYFYITVLLFKTKLSVLKVFAVVSLLFYYVAAYMYGTKTALFYMPTVQKAVHVFQILLILGLEYFTDRKDFQHLE